MGMKNWLIFLIFWVGPRTKLAKARNESDFVLFKKVFGYQWELVKEKLLFLYRGYRSSEVCDKLLADLKVEF